MREIFERIGESANGAVAMNELADRQRTHLKAVAAWAARARETLGAIMLTHGHQVHFRPASGGVAMIGLLPERPQRGKSGLCDLRRVARDFEQLFAAHCRDVPHGRITGEKALQSYLIRDAYAHARHLACLNEASSSTDEPVDLVFVTDEIWIPTAQGNLVCDVLALRCDGARRVPVLIELKDHRMLTRLIAQVQGYAALINAHLDAYSELFSAVLGEPVSLTGPCETWIVWPSAGAVTDPREAELLRHGIRLVGYRPAGDGFHFRVGRGLYKPRVRARRL
ncbi:MAG TPA: hypothetical protein VFZ61_16320 [Polyangiales bacterium]